MTLTMGSGPFGPRRAGAFNFERQGPAHVLYFEDSPRRVRVDAAGHTVADSRRAKLLHETGLPPRWYLPWEDVATEHLVGSDTRTRCPYKGLASHWSVKAGDDVVADVVWAYPDPHPGVAGIAGHACFAEERVDQALDE